MDHLQKVAAEIIQLYRQQLNVWVLGKVWRLKDSDLRQYDRRQERIEQLQQELEREDR